MRILLVEIDWDDEPGQPGAGAHIYDAVTAPWILELDLAVCRALAELAQEAAQRKLDACALVSPVPGTLH